MLGFSGLTFDIKLIPDLPEASVKMPVSFMIAARGSVVSTGPLGSSTLYEIPVLGSTAM